MYWSEKENDIMDSIFNDIKEKFYERLKNDVKRKIKNLEKENKLLNKTIDELIKKVNKYENEERDIKLELNRARLDDLFKETGMINVLYSPLHGYRYKKKCDKCDSDRLLHYKTPRGKDACEGCECSETKIMYFPVENELVKFERNTWRSDKDEHPIFLWFRQCGEEEFNNECGVKHIYNNEPYEELFEKFGKYSNGLFFKSKEDCKKYCDWLSKKFGWTPDMIYDVKGNEIKNKF